MSGDLVRATIRLSDDRSRRVWARLSAPRTRKGLTLRTLSVLAKDGEWTGEVIVATDGDISNVTPARMNLTYAELETAKAVKGP